ncbi:hexosephosphate transport protein [Escherichia coli]|uniref:Hexosephosphate transport protein n=1 Tax=Escherichia coli TaxID=562 RepID=A0A376WTL9_ECOLX|nr:hexosephosphate transport protein [Escherichia coli]
MLAFLNQVRKPTLDLPLEVRRKMWFKPFMQSYLVVFIGYLTMYLIRKNFNIAQNDMISTYGLSMTQLGDDRPGVSPSLMAWVKRWFPTTPTAKTPNNSCRSC